MITQSTKEKSQKKEGEGGGGGDWGGGVSAKFRDSLLTMAY